MSRTLLLIRHSLPQIDSALSAEQWRLSPAGRARCPALADQAAVFAPRLVFSSLEPKAEETAALLAERLSLPCQAIPGLHEHERRTVNFMARGEFEAAVARLFAEPDALVFGEETANQALARFDRALSALIQAHPCQTLAVVAHGTVISLWLSRRLSLPALPLWKSLGLPGLLAIDLDENNLNILPLTYG